MLNNPRAAIVNRHRPRLLTALLSDDNDTQLRMQAGIRCECGARVRCFPLPLDDGFALQCDNGHDFIVVEGRP